MNIRQTLCIAAIAAISLTPACNTVDDDRIPNLPVNISLGDPGLWNSFGVWGFGQSRRFVTTLKEPAGFHYPINASTGFGGVLLVLGMDPFSNDTQIPLAYDLSCPVECRPDIRVYVDTETFEAICPDCGSRYDVTMAGGSPTDGPALTGSRKYGLRRYQVYPTATGGYIITN